MTRRQTSENENPLYVILVNEYSEDLEGEVDEWLKAGYKLAGNLLINRNGEYVQSMIRSDAG